MALSSVTVVGISVLLGRYKPMYADKKLRKIGELYTDKEKDFRRPYSLQTFTRLSSQLDLKKEYTDGSVMMA